VRKLATIQKIKDIQPIPNADKIEVATVNGWNVVIKKDEYNVGDLVVYCEVDSFLPIRDEYEFLRKSSYKKMSDGTEGFRLKTIRLRKQVSQGLILPLDVIPEEVFTELADYTMPYEHDYLIGEDVTEALGIIKYEPPIPAQLSGTMKGNFPSFISKTDEERVQNLTDDYKELRRHRYFVTEKLDGSSSTFYLMDGEFGVCSRNIDLVENDDNTFWKVAKELKIQEKLESLNGNFALQGELIGEGIQKNPYGIKGQTVRFFNVFDINNYHSFPPNAFEKIITSLGLQTVPILYRNIELPETVPQLIDLSDGDSTLNPETIREGLVFRQVGTEENVSFKVISNQFLLNE